MTVVTAEMPEDEAARQAVAEVADDGRLSGFHYKPEEPPTTRVATEVFAFRPDRLLDIPGGATVPPGGRSGGGEATG